MYTIILFFFSQRLLLFLLLFQIKYAPTIKTNVQRTVQDIRFATFVTYTFLVNVAHNHCFTSYHQNLKLPVTSPCPADPIDGCPVIAV